MKLALILTLFFTISYSKESCLNCHSNTTDIDKFHKIKDFGCASCHGGDKEAITKNEAHKNMVLNPARLEHAKIFCAKCHKDIVNRVSKSIMNTQSGILDVLKYQFKESKELKKSKGIAELKDKKNLSLAEEHFSKLCAACHINQDQKVFKNLPKRGGGCVDCHEVPKSNEANYAKNLGLRVKDSEFRVQSSEFKVQKSKPKAKSKKLNNTVMPNSFPHLANKSKELRAKSLEQNNSNPITNYQSLITKKFIHPKFTTKIPSSNCLKCHNRSNRIGFSYFGKFESEGYNHFSKGKVDNKIDAHRSFYNLPADVHHKKGGLDCIDCHSEVGVMGDGKEHKHMEDAQDISCIDCHEPTFKKATDYPLAIKLAYINGKVPMPKVVAITKRKNTPLYNLQKVDNNFTLYRKRDGKAFSVPVLQKPYHSQSFHKRLDCSACHTQWTPSCYGCHEVKFENGKQYDWIKKRATNGQWMELRSYLRYEDNTLSIGYNGKIMPSAPGCQVIMSIYDKNNTFHKGITSLAYGAWSPHTIGKSKKCNECHFSSSALGLGQGIMNYKGDKLRFKPYFNSKANGFDFKFNIDKLVDINGTQKQSFSRDKARAFNKKEIDKIVEVYKCTICHNKWSDKIYNDFNKSKKLFFNNKTKCAIEIFKSK